MIGNENLLDSSVLFRLVYSIVEAKLVPFDVASYPVETMSACQFEFEFEFEFEFVWMLYGRGRIREDIGNSSLIDVYILSVHCRLKCEQM